MCYSREAGDGLTKSPATKPQYQQQKHNTINTLAYSLENTINPIRRLDFFPENFLKLS